MKKIVMFLLGCLVCHVALSQWITSGNNINNTNSGNVGVGTTTPWSRLDVRTAGATAGDQNALNIQNPSSAAYAAVQLSLATGATSNSLIYAQRNNLTNGSSLLFWNTDGSAVLQPRMAITDAGNVGIGTVVPQSMLHIVQNNNLVSLVLESSSAGWGSGMYFKNTAASGKTYGVYASSYGSLNITDASSGVDRIFIAANGNVGINTHGVSDSHYQLCVEGGIRSRKVVVDQTVWADYVFRKDYRLPSLESVDRFIKAHHHLADMPSADSVQRNGIDIGNNQAMLLKKVEELTLYIIEQNKKIEALSAQIKKIQKTRKK
ncbi:MAG TPA: hypothetical protein VL832_00840 [Puia sp.]|nr:hypothetical protein [Puia sp.]